MKEERSTTSSKEKWIGEASKQRRRLVLARWKRQEDGRQEGCKRRQRRSWRRILTERNGKGANRELERGKKQGRRQRLVFGCEQAASKGECILGSSSEVGRIRNFQSLDGQKQGVLRKGTNRPQGIVETWKDGQGKARVLRAEKEATRRGGSQRRVLGRRVDHIERRRRSGRSSEGGGW